MAMIDSNKSNKIIGIFLVFYSLYLIGDLLRKLLIHRDTLQKYFFESVNGKIWILQFFVILIFFIGGVGLNKNKRWAKIY